MKLGPVVEKSVVLVFACELFEVIAIGRYVLKSWFLLVDEVGRLLGFSETVLTTPRLDQQSIDWNVFRFVFIEVAWAYVLRELLLL